jgi:hypothetical protein
MYSELINKVGELLSIDTRDFLILDDTITSNKNTVSISVNLTTNDSNHIEQFVSQVKYEIYRTLYKFIFKEMKYNNKFLDLRNLKFSETLNRTSLFLSQFNYKNLVSNSRISAELQDSPSFHFSKSVSTRTHIHKMKTNPDSDIYEIGNYLNFEAYCDPYLEYSKEGIYLFDDIRFNINNFQYEIVDELTFTPKLKVRYDFYFDSPNSDTVYLIDDEFQKSLPILISQMRDEKIDQLLGE